MTRYTPELWVPNPPADLLTDQDLALHEELAAMSLPAMLDDVVSRTLPHTVDLGEQGFLTMHDMRAENEGNSQEAGVLLLPFGNGFGPSMQIRARVYQRYFPEDMRLLVIANNTRGEQAYDLPRPGDAGELLALKVARGLARVGIERLHIFGDSQGAMIGALLLGHGSEDLEVVSFSAKDAPNTAERLEGNKLQKDFQGKGTENLSALNQAICDTGLPALARAQRVGGRIDALVQGAGMAQFWLGAQQKVNKRLHASMAHRTFADDLERGDLAALGDHGQVVRYENSAVCTKELELDMLRRGLLSHLVRVGHYGHEGTDHVILNAVLNNRAISGVAV